MIKIKGMRRLSGNTSGLLRKGGVWGGCGGFAIYNGRAELGSKEGWEGQADKQGASQGWLERGRCQEKGFNPSTFRYGGCGCNSQRPQGDG